jgi:hypothetical protein
MDRWRSGSTASIAYFTTSWQVVEMKSADAIIDEYGRVLQKLQAQNVAQIILGNPPEIPASAKLPAWSTMLESNIPVFVPARHRLAEKTGNSGIVNLNTDSDGVLRRSALWHLNGDVMSPSLPLAIAMKNSTAATAPRMSGSDDAVFFSSYKEIPRIRGLLFQLQGNTTH